MENTPLKVSDAIALINQTLDYAYPTIVVEGEVSSFKINQQKFVFFDLKDESATLGCFMMVFQLRVPLEDGMKIRVVAQPKLTQWGKFSLTVRDIQLVGEGTIKRSFQLLRAKLEKEGLFDESRKRQLPAMPSKIAIISSTQAAGYSDFMKILSDRWGGMEIIVANTAVQGADAARQIVRALDYLNQLPELPEIIVIIRGGGSLDDLSAFNDEPLVRAVASSRVPVVTGIGHEIDTSLVDLASDVRAATPTNAATIIVPDRREIIGRSNALLETIISQVENRLRIEHDRLHDRLLMAIRSVESRHRHLLRHFELQRTLLVQLDPKAVLKRGYSLLYDTAGKIITTARVGDRVTVETKTSTITAGVTHVTEK